MSLWRRHFVLWFIERLRGCDWSRSVDENPIWRTPITPARPRTIPLRRMSPQERITAFMMNYTKQLHVSPAVSSLLSSPFLSPFTSQPVHFCWAFISNFYVTLFFHSGTGTTVFLGPRRVTSICAPQPRSRVPLLIPSPLPSGSCFLSVIENIETLFPIDTS